MKEKILIIKTGQFETFQLSDDGETISLGDIVRTTVILNLFEHKEIVWLTNQKALILLNNLNIKTALSIDALDLSTFDFIVNLERDAEVLKKIHSLDKKKIIGFVYNENGQVHIRSISDLHPLTPQDWIEKQIKNGLHFWQEWLFALFNKKWDRENYIISHKNQKVTHDIGLNWKVGDKWPEKSLSKDYWEDLYQSLINTGLSTTWQKGFDHLEEYINWIASCRVLITHDSLGLHLALALNKKVVLLGPSAFTKSVPILKQGIKVPVGFDSPFQSEAITAEVQKMFPNIQNH